MAEVTVVKCDRAGSGKILRGFLAFKDLVMDEKSDGIEDA
jgi:hypothetical protein